MSHLYNKIFDDIPDSLNAEINPYVTDLIAAKDGSLPIMYGSLLQNSKGNWNQIFNERNKSSAKQLVLEIGCHKGHTIREMAHAHPEVNFIGLDITFKRVVYTGKRAKSANLPNIISVLGNALQSDCIFAENELDGVVIFFPDPWCKKVSQAKHRLISPDFCKLLQTIIKPNGFFWFKTDHDGYFADVTEYLKNTAFKPEHEIVGLPSETYETTFERKFRLLNEPTNSGVWTNKKI